ncbi:MAG: hypothetical protein ACI9P7_002541 [Candidatus Azotimanducaceae bacterium]|jgi:hypothetical protein
MAAIISTVNNVISIRLYQVNSSGCSIAPRRRSALRYPVAERDYQACQRKASQADLSVPRKLSASDQLRLPHIDTEPRKKREAVHMVQCVEIARPRCYGKIVCDRKTEHYDGRHYEGGPGKELRPPAVRLGRRDVNFFFGHIPPSGA